MGASTPRQYGSYFTFDEAQEYIPPSAEQITELLNNTTSVWTTLNGYNGRKFTGSNGESVFLPAAGYWNFKYGEFNGAGSWGYYWSSTPYDEDFGYELCFYSGSARRRSYSRYLGRSVRPVR